MEKTSTESLTLHESEERVRRRRFADRLARFFVTLGGAAIIIVILAILLVIVFEIMPLFRSPAVSTRSTLPAGGDSTGSILGVGVDEYREMADLVESQDLRVVSLKDGAEIDRRSFREKIGEATVTSSSRTGRGPFALGLSDGRILPLAIEFGVSFPDDVRTITPEFPGFESEAPFSLRDEDEDESVKPVTLLSYAQTDDGPVVAAALDARSIGLVFFEERENLLTGEVSKEAERETLVFDSDGEITSLLIDSRAEELFVGTSRGELLRFDLRDREEILLQNRARLYPDDSRAVTALEFLVGDRTVVVGDASGRVSTWQLTRQEDDHFALEKMHEFESHAGAVTALAHSIRNKGFLSAGDDGSLKLHYGTTGETLLSVDTGEDAASPVAISIAPKSDGFLAVDSAAQLHDWGLSNPHPEVSWSALFHEVWYEGYSEPDHVWQSTGATDDFESKTSLVPLLFGTIKGTLYALLFAVPLALLGAIDASEFLHPKIKNFVKDVIEIMAALPSVVLGFLAGLWLAPRFERYVPAIFISPIVIALCIFGALLLWRKIPLNIRGRLKPGTELLFLGPVVLLGALLSYYLGGVLEVVALQGDYKSWLSQFWGLTFDQRNSMVVGLAMGFAVIPIIFTIAEDSLSSVPRLLAAGSLAVGATRWQTVVRVILPTASPGIFSAVMIGLGRAVGETMIVLMAAGNTPIMEWSVFNGFRALSANIAVELPEAPEGGTLFRVLFLSAFLLFVMTFAINTVAEVVRVSLRKRYRYYE